MPGLIRFSVRALVKCFRKVFPVPQQEGKRAAVALTRFRSFNKGADKPRFGKVQSAYSNMAALAG